MADSNDPLLDPVLVTGGSGFIGGHVVLALLERGARVRATVRSLATEPELRARLAAAGAEPGDALELVEADLTADAGWDAAMAGVGGVVHVASPVPRGGASDDDAIVTSAVDGTTRVLTAAREAGVPRAVVTSAFHAIGFGWGAATGEKLFTEDDWSPLDGPGMDAYGRSKVLAERAAWDIAADGRLEVVALNPVAVLGPLLGGSAASLSGGSSLLRALLVGAMPAIPDLWLPIVDVRDVAAAHAAALTTPEAAGRRLLLASGEGMTLAEIAALYRAELGEAARRIPTEFGPAGPGGTVKHLGIERAERVLGWSPRPARTTVLDAAESMLASGVVEP